MKIDVKGTELNSGMLNDAKKSLEKVWLHK
jgi:hypothetical protein